MESIVFFLYAALQETKQTNKVWAQASVKFRISHDVGFACCCWFWINKNDKFINTFNCFNVCLFSLSSVHL